MLKKAKRIVAVFISTMMLLVMTVSANAALFGDISTENCKFVGSASLDEFTITGKLSKSNNLTVHILLGDEAKVNEFWNNPEGYIQYDIRLDTETACEPYAVLPVFGKNWLWIDPTNIMEYNYVKYNEWITVSEPLTNYYDKAFKDEKNVPDRMLVNVRTDHDVTEELTFSIRNVRFVGADGAEATTTPATTTTAEEVTTTTPAETEPEVIEPAETAEESTPADTAEAPAESEPEQTTAATTSTAKETEPAESEPEQTTAATTTKKPATYATTAAVSSSSQNDVVGTIVIIVVVAVVIVAAAVVGYIIYRKKKYY